MAAAPLTEKVFRRRVRLQSIEAHPTELAVVVKYDIEVAVVKDGRPEGEAELTERRVHSETIQLTGLNAHTDIELLAQQIVEKHNKTIGPSKLKLVENVLFLLQQREVDGGLPGDDALAAMRSRRFDAMAPNKAAEAQICHLDEYIEKLYSTDVQEEIQATALVLQLVKDANNLQILVSHETLLGALTRMLQENTNGKSMDLVFNVVQILLVLSHFNQFHALLTRYRGGVLVMHIIDFELRRDAHNKALLQKLKEDKAMPADDREQQEAQIKAMQKRQDKLLYACSHILYNLAQDPSVEKKMVQKGIVKYLVAMTERRNAELLTLCTTFLRKLSVFKENKDQMAELGIVKLLVGYLGVQNEVLLDSVLRLAFNLSFDPALRLDMVSQGTVTKVALLLSRPKQLDMVLKLLYQLSLDDAGRSAFAFTDAFDQLAGQLQDPASQLVLPLYINLTANARNALIVREGQHFKKIVRNLAQAPGASRAVFAPYLPTLVQLAAKSVTETDLLVEVLGVIANFHTRGEDNAPEIKWQWIDCLPMLVPILVGALAPGSREDDTVLEAVMVAGVAVADVECATVMAQSNVPQLLERVFHEKQQDDEIILQVVFTLAVFLSYEPTRKAVLANTPRMIACLVDLLHDQNVEIRCLCDQVLDMLQEVADSQWQSHVRELKFTLHNPEWQALLRDDDSEGETEFFVAQDVADELAFHPNDTTGILNLVGNLDDPNNAIEDDL